MSKLTGEWLLLEFEKLLGHALLYTAVYVDFKYDTVEDKPLMKGQKICLFSDKDRAKEYIHQYGHASESIVIPDELEIQTRYCLEESINLLKNGSVDSDDVILPTINILLDMVYFLGFDINDKSSNSHPYLVALARYLFLEKDTRMFFEKSPRTITYIPTAITAGYTENVDFPDLNYPLSLTEVVEAFEELHQFFIKDVIVLV